ncbi:hypothetical protein CYMTET_13587 [Cymbomonas tetramitiformis]|uniref:Dynein heavy chain tail domain-containing protein n=1 Tax=Cymbomonas tetramitiformis TaxID=36881 RepID=A0AAE0GJB8_9CHLO|nr:hypothetical protein CYMTET_13587 [Cymbomonas tetramitiformis]
MGRGEGKGEQGTSEDTADRDVGQDTARCIEWFAERVTITYKLKPEKWRKFVSSKENVMPLGNFLDSPQERRILFFFGGKDELMCSTTVPVPTPKKKLFYALRRAAGSQLTPENLAEQLVVGDLQSGLSSVLDQVVSVTSQVYAPLLKGPLAKNEWPVVVSADVDQHLERFNATISAHAFHAPLSHVASGAPQNVLGLLADYCAVECAGKVLAVAPPRATGGAEAGGLKEGGFGRRWSRQARGASHVSPLPKIDHIQSRDSTDIDREKVQKLEVAVSGWAQDISKIADLEFEVHLFGVKQEVAANPEVILEFWGRKVRDLSNISILLNSKESTLIMALLEVSRCGGLRCLPAACHVSSPRWQLPAPALPSSASAQSKFVSLFPQIQAQVKLALRKARQNIHFLEPIRPLLREINTLEDRNVMAVSGEDKMAECRNEQGKLFTKLLFSVVLVTKYSEGYQTAKRLVTLLRCIALAVERQARHVLSSHSILRLEPEEVYQRVQLVFNIMDDFKHGFDRAERFIRVIPKDKRLKIEAAWGFKSDAVMGSLELFMDRAKKLLRIVQSMEAFGRLEKLEMGGDQGSKANLLTRRLHVDFLEAKEQLALRFAKELPSMEAADANQDAAMVEFQQCDLKLQERLAGILDLAFNCCGTTVTAFKVIESFQGLGPLTHVQARVNFCLTELVSRFHKEVLMVDELVSHATDPSKIPIPFNMPPVAGALMWIRGLQQRIEPVNDKFTQCKIEALDCQELPAAREAYVRVIKVLTELENALLTRWAGGISDSREKLDEVILKEPVAVSARSVQTALPGRATWQSTDPALTAAREIKYSQGDRSSKWPATCTNTAVGIQKLVEIPLHRDLSAAVNALLALCLSEIKWCSKSLMINVRELLAACQSLHEQVQQIKENREALEEIVERWKSIRLMEHDSSKSLPADPESDLITCNYAAFAADNTVIHNLLESSRTILKAKDDDPGWRNFVAYCNKAVLSGLRGLLKTSLNVLMHYMEQNRTPRVPPHAPRWPPTFTLASHANMRGWRTEHPDWLMERQGATVGPTRMGRG